MGAYKQQEQNKKDNRASSRKPKAGKVPFSDFVFITIDLTTEEKDDFKLWVADIDPIERVLRDLVTDGCKLSFSTGDNGNTAICSLSITDADDVNAGGVITARGKTADIALAVLLYKLHIVGERTWRQAMHERGGTTTSDIG